MPNPIRDDIAYPEEEKAKQDVNLAPPRRLQSFQSRTDPDTSGPVTWGDWGTTLKIGTEELAGYAAAGARFAGEEFDLPKMAKEGKFAQDEWHAATATAKSELTPAAKARLEAAIDDPDFYTHIGSSLALKGLEMTPTLVASIVPATITSGAAAASIAAAGVGSAINTASYVDEVQTALDAMPSDELAKQSPVFAKLLAKNNGNEAASRKEFNNVVMGMMPVYVAGASFLAEVFGPGAQIARKLAGGSATIAGHTGWRGILSGAKEGALSETVEEGAAAVGAEQAQVEAGAQTEINQSNVARRALTGGALGATFGGAIGVAGSGHKGARGEKTIVPDEPTVKPEPTPTEPVPAPKIENTTSSPAKPSTALPEPKIAQATEHPEKIVPGQPRRRPLPKKVVTPEGNTAIANPEAVTATPSTGFEKADGSGMNSAIAAALAPDVPPVQAAQPPIAPSQPRPRLQSAPGTPTPPNPNVTVGEAPSQPSAAIGPPPVEATATPPGTVPTALGLATEPRPIEAPPVAITGARGSPATGTRVDPVKSIEARAPTNTPIGPRVLEDTRPEVVAQNRLISFQEKERMLANQRALAAEEKAASGEAVGRPLYGKAKAKAEGDAAIAKGLFDQHVPETDVIPTKPAEKAALKSRLDTVMADAKTAGLKVPTNINYEGANPTADHMVWLREVADLQKAMDQEKGAPQKQITQFLIRERAAKKGDFGLMKSERRSEGDIAKRGQQQNVETVADTTKLLASKENAEGVAAEVTSKAHADADAVPTVASATKRGSVRFGEESQGAASEGKKVEVSKISPEEKARIIAASNRVVAEAGKEAPKPAQRPVNGSVKEPEPKLPSKVTTKVAEKVTLAKKIAAEAKKVERDPSPEQIAAGNYAKGHVSVQGIPITMETVSGTTRKGFKQKLPAGTHYGEIKSTRGADGENLDVFLGPHPDSDFALVMDQVDPFTKEFDEHKTFVGYRNVREATEAYVQAFDSQGPERIGGLTPMTINEFKEWIKGDTTKPVDDMAVAREARDEAGWDTTDTSVELDDSDIRSKGPVIPHTNGIHSIETYDAVEALNLFAKPENTKGLAGTLYPFLKRALIKALTNSDVKVHFVTDENFAKLHGGEEPLKAIAFYDPALGHVIVRRGVYNVSPARQAHAVMHELAHAATVGVLDAERFNGTNKDPHSATYQLTALMLDVKRQVIERAEDYNDLWTSGAITPDKIYGFKNIREFVAEAISNEAFQEVLEKINVSSYVATHLQLGVHQKVSFWKAFVQKIREHLGMPKDTYSALEATLSMSERLIYGSRLLNMEAEYNRALGQTGATSRITLPDITMQKLNRPEASTPKNLQDNLEGNLKEFIEKRKQSVRRSVGDPKILRFRSLTDMAALAKGYFRGNSVRRVVNAIEAIRVTGGEIAKRADPVIHALISAERKYRGTKAFEEMTSIMHDATMSDVHPDRSLAANTHLGKKSMAGFWGRQQHPALQARYDALPADLKQIYQDSRKLFEDLHNQSIKQSLENRVLKALGHNDPGLADRIFNDKVTDDDKATLGDDYELVAEAMDFKKAEGPYFPLKRFGNNVVRGRYKIEDPAGPHRVIDANTFEFDTQKAAESYVAQSKLHADLDSVYVDQATGSRYFLDEKGKEVPVLAQDTDAVRRWRVRVQDKHLEFFENRSDAETRRQELVDAGVTMEPVVPRRNDPRMAHGDMLSTHMDRLMHRIEGRDAFKNMPEHQQNEVRRAVEEASYGVLSSTRIQTSRMQRRYVEGASKDIVRSTAEYTGSMAGYLSRYEHQGELDSALKEMNKEADGLTSEGNNPQTAHGRGQIRDEIMYRINQPNIAASGSANRTFDQWMHRLRVTSFIGHLASPAYSLINATQPIMITTPILSARHGLGSSVAAMTRAYSDIAAIKSFAQGVVNTGRRAADQLAETNTYVGDMMARISNPGEKAMMNYLVKHGAIDADAGMEISKLVDRGTGDQWLSYFEGISRQLPLAVESVNRGVSALAAYRLEMKRTGDHEASVLYAQEIVESTQGIYANTNMPPIFSANPIASLAFQFKKYGHMIYSLLGQQIGKAIRNANPGDRAEAIKALGYIAAAHVAMAGTVGLPTEPIKMLLIGANMLGLTGLTMADFEEWQREQFGKLVGNTGAEMLTHGVTRGLPGGMAMDLSNRLGMQDFMTFGEPKSTSSGDIYSFVGETMLGAPGGSLINMAQGAGQIANGNIAKGMELMVPVKLIADGLKAYQLMSEGKLSKSGRQVAAPLTMPEAALRLFGIQPGRIANQQQAASSFYRNTGRETKQRSAFMDQYAVAKGVNRAKVWKKIQEWNKTLPQDSRLTFSHLTDYVRNRGKENLSNTVGGIKITKQNKAIAERVKELYNQ